MKPLIYGLIALIVLSGTGCSDSTSDTMEVDTAPAALPDNRDVNSYSGRVMDGYLQNAVVWLDLNDNKLHEEGEPITRSGEHGVFHLDLTPLNDARRLAGEPLLEPRLYPLMAIAVAGETLEEGATEDVVVAVDKSYFLMAPASTTVVSPLTTLIKLKKDLDFNIVNHDDLETVRSQSNQAHNSLVDYLENSGNFSRDYLLAEDHRLQVYAKVFTEMVKKNVTGQLDSLIRSGDYDAFNDDSISQIGRFALSNMRSLLSQIDQLAESAGGDYSTVDALTAISYPTVELNLNDPYLLTSELTYKSPTLVDGETFEFFNQRLDDSHLSTRTDFVYNANGDLLNVIVDGYKDLYELALVQNSELSLLLATDIFQFWGQDQVADQVMSWTLRLNKFEALSADSRHPLDFQPTLSKTAARDLLENAPESYSLDGQPDVVATYEIVTPKLFSGELSRGGENYQFDYTYDPQDRLSSVDVLKNGEVVQRLVYSYNFDKAGAAQDTHVAYRVEFYRVTDEGSILEKAVEFFSKPVDLGDRVVEMVTDIFIESPLRPRAEQYLVWELDRYDPIEIGKDFNLGLPSDLSSNREEDIVTARGLLEGTKEASLEGKIRRATLYAANALGNRNNQFGISAVYSVVDYTYERLSEFVFSLSTQ